MTEIVHDSEYFRRRAAEARAAAFCKDQGESVEIAGDLALAYAALARRKAVRQPTILAEPQAEAPLLLRE